MKNYFSKYKIRLSLLVVVLIAYYFSLPKQLFKDSTSTVIESVEGYLLGAKIAKDMQWRFPENDSVSVKFGHCITQYEDAYFYKHWGFNPISIVKAFNENRKAKKVIRGGSTLTQQVIRLARKNKRRTYLEKFIELILATRLEFKYSKKKILSLYASHAPFGGNVVGIDAASWRYFGQNSQNLSWAENATLAVLPNAPGLININKNRIKLKEKRNRLLKKLFQKSIIDSLTYHLATQENLPEKTFPLPQFTPHLLEKINKKHSGKRIQTSIKIGLQKQLNSLIKQHYNELQQNHIYNAAAIIIDVKTRNIVAYVGNTPTDKTHQKDVDIIDKARSTGSILKPFLYTSLLNAGEILPNTLIADIPTQIAGYKPENFNLKYYGAVPAGKALTKSLNIPAVRMLQFYGLDRFYHDLNNLKLNTISKGANHYGLSLILGGAESSLWDLTRAYTGLASTLNHYDQTQGEYYEEELVELNYFKKNTSKLGKKTKEYPIYDAGSIYTTFNTLLEVNRPEGDENWEFFDNSKSIAWKTGTSFGFRDAWAIGINPDFVVGVWVGNADGEGRPGLTGITTAAPILFDIYDLLPNSNWFSPPYDELEKIATCQKSGYRKSDICTEIDSIWIPRAGLKTQACPHHQWIHLDYTESYRVNSSCEPLSKMKHKSWFVLPPIQAYYYQQHNPFYKPLPPYRTDCLSNTESPMEFINTFKNEHIFLPKDFEGELNSLVIKVKHTQVNTKVFWYLNAHFIKTTQAIHEIAIKPKKGVHTLTVVDEFGYELKKEFKILE
ncbi:MAG TPA: penicillin-binding protein 1C [Lutibacter sp.]|nr:penicillin-binding protein 1C [Lutibacter sp.]